MNEQDKTKVDDLWVQAMPVSLHIKHLVRKITENPQVAVLALAMATTEIISVHSDNREECAKKIDVFTKSMQTIAASFYDFVEKDLHAPGAFTQGEIDQISDALKKAAMGRKAP